MGRKKQVEPEVELLSQSTEVETVSVADLEQEELDSRPAMTDPGWEPYIMTQFMPHELAEGKPKVNGLRRLVRKELGEIVECVISPVTPPHFDGKNRVYCTYAARVVIDRHDGGALIHQDVGDFNEDTCGDRKFLGHASATCATRVEGRVYRKLLGLDVCAYGEIAADVPEKIDPERKITDEQLSWLNSKFARLDIDGRKFISVGKKWKFSSPKEIPYDVCKEMCQTLSGFENKMSTIPDQIKGYQENWSK